MQIIITIILFSVGTYLILLGLGKQKFPAKMSGHEEVRWLGQLIILFGFFSLLSCFGIHMSMINEWISDVLTTGGGAGTG